MLEAGLVQKKDVSEIVTKNLGLYSIACIMYLTCGFMLMYPSGGAFGGALESYLPAIGSSLSLSTALPNEEIGMPYGMDYSQQADFFFQVVFVATAMSIVSGAVAGRMKLLPFFIFAIVLTGFIYPIQGYWNWGGGFLSSGGYSDYAGSGTVHLCGAAAALAVVTVLGARKGKYNFDGTSNAMPGSNIPMAALGAWILWLGWFGFNGGSELIVSDEASAIAVSQVFLNTNMAAAGGVVAALFTSLFLTGKMDVTMAINGAIAGLVAITAGPSAPSGGTAVLIGAVGGIIVYFSILFLDKTLKIDDPVGAISAHGIVGIFGVMVVPLTSDASFGMQFVGVVAIGGFTYVASLITIFVINMVMPIRATDEEQDMGLDASEIGVESYPEFK
jgi:Amt family ammonium transporter